MRVYGTIRVRALHFSYANLATRAFEGSTTKGPVVRNVKRYSHSHLQEDFFHTFTRGFSLYFEKPFFPIHFPIVGPGSAYLSITSVYEKLRFTCITKFAKSNIRFFGSRSRQYVNYRHEIFSHTKFFVTC